MDWWRYQWREEKQPARRPDFWVRMIGVTAFSGWLAFLGAGYLVAAAKPEIKTFFGFYTNQGARQGWDMELMRIVRGLLVFALVSGGIGLVINSRRHRRKEDYFRLSLVLLVLAAAAGLARYWAVFS